MQGVVRWVKTRAAHRDASRGQLLIEVLIGLAVLGLISVVFIGAMYTSLHAARITDERSVALTLAKSQIEFVRSAGYSTDDWAYTVKPLAEGGATTTVADQPSWWTTSPSPALASEYAGYAVDVTGTSDVDLNGTGGFDAGIRTIAAVVSHQGTVVFTLENYEVDR